MTALELMKKRRSCRGFKKDVVEQEKIDKVIEAGLYAACGMGYQYGIILAITNEELVLKTKKLNAKIMGANPDVDPFYGAPVILLVAVKRWRNAPYDGACMIENMMLEATELNLGSCWIHRAKEELTDDLYKEVFSSIGLNADDYEGVGHVALGYSDGTPYREKTIHENRVYYIK